MTAAGRRSLSLVTTSDTGTVALQLAWLNDHYAGRGAYFALLRAPGLDLQAFPAPEWKRNVWLAIKSDIEGREEEAG